MASQVSNQRILLLSEAPDSIVVVSSTSAGSQVARTSSCGERVLNVIIPLAGVTSCVAATGVGVSTLFCFSHDSQILTNAGIAGSVCLVIEFISICIILNVRFPDSH